MTKNKKALIKRRDLLLQKLVDLRNEIKVTSKLVLDIEDDIYSCKESDGE